MKTIKIQLETLSCPSCIERIGGKLSKEKGVEIAQVFFNASKVKVKFDENETTIGHLKAVIEKLGYKVLEPDIQTV